MSCMYVAWRPPLGLLSMDTARAVAQGFPLHVLTRSQHERGSVCFRRTGTRSPYYDAQLQPDPAISAYPHTDIYIPSASNLAASACLLAIIFLALSRLSSRSVTKIQNHAEISMKPHAKTKLFFR
jgi:hypothetical protein